MTQNRMGGVFTLGDRQVRRMGYGAMQLTGPRAFGPPKDHARALAVLREAVAAGVNHIDTSDYYGPYVVNELIREALHPYPKDLTIVTKLGAFRGEGGSWTAALTRADLERGVHDNLTRLGRDALDVVNLRVGPPLAAADASLAEPLRALMDLQRQGLIRGIGISNVTARQIAEARALTKIVCVQNQYNLVQRQDDAIIDNLAKDGIAYVPFYPLGGFTPLQSDGFAQIAAELGATTLQVALAWLLQRAPNILLIPGTSSPAHLKENLAAAEIKLSPEVVTRLNGLK